jgi:excisionase family DNA binding protein
MAPVFVDARGLAERLYVSYDTVLGWVRRGRIPHVRDGRGRLLFNLNAVLAALLQSPQEDSKSGASRREVDHAS